MRRDLNRKESENMRVNLKDKAYEVDELGFLTNYDHWDENFASEMASRLKIPEGLSKKHWDVIYFVRKYFFKNGICPRVFETCKANKLAIRDMERLFPTGYQRGACLLAGISYKDRLVNYYGELVSVGVTEKEVVKLKDKIYRIDAYGFLVDPSEWDKDYALNKALEMKIPGGLTKKHWEILQYLRDSWQKNGTAPTVYECCESNHIEAEDLAKLFPDGYQRGAIKIAGLRIK